MRKHAISDHFMLINIFLDTKPFVMFSVGLTKNATVLGGSIAVFDKVFVDTRQSYNTSTGTFVAPVTGLYEFTYHVLGKEGSMINVCLRLNGRYATIIFFRYNI